jgi:hypothetical protein
MELTVELDEVSSMELIEVFQCFLDSWQVEDVQKLVCDMFELVEVKKLYVQYVFQVFLKTEWCPVLSQDPHDLTVIRKGPNVVSVNTPG